MDNHAVVDLGSNTFHILIYNFTEAPFKVVFRKRVYVFLSEEGVERIGDNAFVNRPQIWHHDIHRYAKWQVFAVISNGA